MNLDKFDRAKLSVRKHKYMQGGNYVMIIKNWFTQFIKLQIKNNTNLLLTTISLLLAEIAQNMMHKLVVKIRKSNIPLAV